MGIVLSAITRKAVGRGWYALAPSASGSDEIHWLGSPGCWNSKTVQLTVGTAVGLAPAPERLILGVVAANLIAARKRRHRREQQEQGKNNTE